MTLFVILYVTFCNKSVAKIIICCTILNHADSLIEFLEYIFRDFLCIFVRNGLHIKCRHSGTGLSHNLDNIVFGFYVVRFAVFFMKGFLRIDDITAVRMAKCTVLLEQ